MLMHDAPPQTRMRWQDVSGVLFRSKTYVRKLPRRGAVACCVHARTHAPASVCARASTVGRRARLLRGCVSTAQHSRAPPPQLRRGAARAPAAAACVREAAWRCGAARAMFAAINASADDAPRDDGETVEAQCCRVTATYERALHALHGGARAEAQGAWRAGGGRGGAARARMQP